MKKQKEKAKEKRRIKSTEMAAVSTDSQIHTVQASISYYKCVLLYF